jgi:RNA polymerase sigma factor (sigma-70 family)
MNIFYSAASKVEIVNIVATAATYCFIKDICKSFAHGDADELYQDFFIICLEYPEEKLLKTFNEGYFKYWAVNVLKKQYFSSTSTFYRTHKKYKTIIDSNAQAENCIEESNFEREMFLNQLEEFLENKMHWYHATLFKYYYFENKSIRDIEKQTKIKRSAVWDSINYSRSIVKQHFSDKFF